MISYNFIQKINPPTWIKSITTLTYSFSISAALSAAVHILIPRMIGPINFGKIHLFESLSATIFLLSSLGIDQFIRKELPCDTGDSSRAYISRILRLRFALFVAIITLSSPLILSNYNYSEDAAVGIIFLFIQCIITTNSTYSAILHAKGRFRDASLIAIRSKLIWSALSVFVAYFFKLPLYIALAILISELFRLFLLSTTAPIKIPFLPKKNERLFGSIWPLLPFILSTSFQQIYARIDVQMISLHNEIAEVGWYGAACTITSIGLIAIPSLVAVLTPEYATSTGKKERQSKFHQSLYLSSSIFTILSIAMMCFSVDIIQLIYGYNYLPATNSLIVLSSIIPFTYIASICGIHLTSTGKIWHLTAVTLLGLAINITLNVHLIPYFSAMQPQGGGSLGAAIASLINELTMVSILLFLCLGNKSNEKN